MKFNFELILSTAFFNPTLSPSVEEKRVMRFIEMDTMKWDANDLRRVLDSLEDDHLETEQQKDAAAFSVCAMVVGMYKDGDIVLDLDSYLFNQGIAYRSDK